MTVTIAVRGHRGERLVITRHARAEHVLDALFDDPFLPGLERAEITREGIALSFAEPGDALAKDIVRKQVLALLGPPRWEIDQE